MHMLARMCIYTHPEHEIEHVWGREHYMTGNAQCLLAGKLRANGSLESALEMLCEAQRKYANYDPSTPVLQYIASSIESVKADIDARAAFLSAKRAEITARVAAAQAAQARTERKNKAT